jgi:hypothetical protein
VSVVAVTESTVEDTSTLKVSTGAAEVGVSLVDEEQDANKVAIANRISTFFIFCFLICFF